MTDGWLIVWPWLLFFFPLRAFFVCCCFLCSTPAADAWNIRLRRGTDIVRPGVWVRVRVRYESRASWSWSWSWRCSCNCSWRWSRTHNNIKDNAHMHHTRGVNSMQAQQQQHQTLVTGFWPKHTQGREGRRMRPQLQATNGWAAGKLGISKLKFQFP